MSCLRPLLFLILASCTLAAAPWKLVLKDGRTIECEAPPIVIDGAYLFRQVDGSDGNLQADEIDVEKTAAANKVEAKPRWREISRTHNRAPLSEESGGGGDGSVLTLADSNFGAEVLRSDSPVLVDFTATWCGPCRQIAPTIDALAAKYSGRVRIGRLDVDRSRSTADHYGVHSYPTLLLFKNGAVVGKIVGGASKNEIAQLINANL